MPTVHHVEGYEHFAEFIKNFENAQNDVIVYFSGKKLPGGQSWCDDCVRAWPVIEESLSKLDKNAQFIYVEVGDRPTWKDMNCKFRTDARLRLMQIPALMRWGTPRKLEGEQCGKPELLELLFDDE